MRQRLSASNRLGLIRQKRHPLLNSPRPNSGHSHFLQHRSHRARNSHSLRSAPRSALPQSPVFGFISPEPRHKVSYAPKVLVNCLIAARIREDALEPISWVLVIRIVILIRALCSRRCILSTIKRSVFQLLSICKWMPFIVCWR